MLYQAHDLAEQGLRNYFNFMSGASRVWAATLDVMRSFSPLPDFTKPLRGSLEAGAVLMERAAKIYEKPAFNLGQTMIAGKSVAVTEENVADKTYCALKHFRRDTGCNDPKILLVAPMSGHYATLLRGTVEALLPGHDVYITDWKNARDIPSGKGEFGLDDYIQYVQDFIRQLGPDVHVMAVCQPTVPVMAAVSLMAQDNDPAQPLSMTLMGGPIDTAAAPTAVSELAEERGIDWFRNFMVHETPGWYEGAGQKVYPGFMQLMAFIAMNPERHINAHLDLFNHIAQGDDAAAEKIMDFYDEYFAVCDLPGKFYLETVKKIFQDRDLARGKLVSEGRRVDPGAITQTPLFTVEGSEDDIAAPGQTTAAHGLMKGLKPDQHFHYLQEGAGHYGIFNGSKWRNEIAPRIAGFVRQAAARQGIFYDAAPDAKAPARWIATPPKANDNGPAPSSLAAFE
jgi:poly(3-hydroxybutyrate) depolymerase